MISFGHFVYICALVVSFANGTTRSQKPILPKKVMLKKTAKPYLVLAIYSLYDVFNGYSWCQAIFASFFYCYWSRGVPSQMVVATAKLDNVIMISQNCATITCYSIVVVACPLPRLNLQEKTAPYGLYQKYNWIYQPMLWFILRDYSSYCAQLPSSHIISNVLS